MWQDSLHSAQEAVLKECCPSPEDTGSEFTFQKSAIFLQPATATPRGQNHDLNLDTIVWVSDQICSETECNPNKWLTSCSIWEPIQSRGSHDQFFSEALIFTASLAVDTYMNVKLMQPRHSARDSHLCRVLNSVGKLCGFDPPPQKDRCGGGRF